MELLETQVGAPFEAQANAAEELFIELGDLQLALIGGGCGEVVLA